MAGWLPCHHKGKIGENLWRKDVIQTTAHSEHRAALYFSFSDALSTRLSYITHVKNSDDYRTIVTIAEALLPPEYSILLTYTECHTRLFPAQ